MRRRGREVGRKGYYRFDGRCEPEGGTLAGMGIESQLVEGVCDVCGLDKRIKVGLKTRRRMKAEVAGGV
jgi:hypothetical protein